MNKFYSVLIFLISFFVLTTVNAQAPGCPNVNAGEDVSFNCRDGITTDLNATFLQTGQTTDYEISSIDYAPPFPFTGGTPVSVNEDDVWSPRINLPFDFCFFGNDYNQLTIGSNGVVSFDVDRYPEGSNCEYEINASVPSPVLLRNAIFGVYTDIDPVENGSGQINFEIFGQAPCRTVVINFPDIKYFSPDGQCRNLSLTSQIVIYETTNVVEVYVGNRDSGCNWEQGRAVLGIQNEFGTQGYTPPGRNTGDWKAFDEAWRFTPNGTSNVEFSWLDENNQVVGTDATLTVTVSEETTFTAQAIYNLCNGQNITVRDDINLIPEVDFAIDLGPDIIVCDIEEVVLDVAAPNVPNITYQWFLDGNAIAGATNGVYTVTSPNEGLYSVEVTDNMTCSYSNEVNVSFIPSPVVNTPPPYKICDTDDTNDGLAIFDLSDQQFRDTILQGQPFMIDFFLTEIAAETNQDPLPTNYSNTSNLQIIYARITGSNGCFVTVPVTLQVVDNFKVDLGSDIETCNNVDDIVLDANPNGLSNLTFQWFLEGNAIVNATMSTYTITSATSGTYSVEVMVENLCTSIDDIVIIFFENPTANEPQPYFICDDESIDGIATFNLASPQFQNEILQGQSGAITFFLSEVLAIEGEDVLPIDYENVTNPQVIYARITTDAGCFDTIPVTLRVIEGFDENLGADISSCLEDNIFLDVSSDTPNLTYQWFLNENPIFNATDPTYTAVRPNSGTYTVEVVAEGLCNYSESINITFLQTPIANMPQPFELCDIDGVDDDSTVFDLNDAQLSQEILQGQNSTLQFFFTQAEADIGENPLPADYPNISNPQIIFARVIDPVNQCFSTVPVTLVVKGYLNVDIENVYRICIDKNDTVVGEEEGEPSPVLIDTGLIGSQYSFIWQLNGTDIIGETGSFIIPSEAGEYSVTVMDNDLGCSATDSATVNASSAPFTFNAEVVTNAFSENPTIEASADGLGDYMYQLDDGNFQDNGTFTNVLDGSHTVTIKDANGCGSVVIDLLVVDYPDFMTPNQDGFNDRWNITGISELDPSAKIYIFDRFGKLLKQLDPSGNGWDGTFGGRLLPSSDYWFRVEFTEDGISKEFKGHFTLKR